MSFRQSYFFILINSSIWKIEKNNFTEYYIVLLHPDKHTLYLASCSLYLATQSLTENPLIRIYQFKFKVSIIILNYTF